MSFGRPTLSWHGRPSHYCPKSKRWSKRRGSYGFIWAVLLKESKPLNENHASPLAYSLIRRATTTKSKGRCPRTPWPAALGKKLSFLKVLSCTAKESTAQVSGGCAIKDEAFEHKKSKCIVKWSTSLQADQTFWWGRYRTTSSKTKPPMLRVDEIVRSLRPFQKLGR